MSMRPLPLAAHQRHIHRRTHVPYHAPLYSANDVNTASPPSLAPRLIVCERPEGIAILVISWLFTYTTSSSLSTM